jgi:hypothetical protein
MEHGGIIRAKDIQSARRERPATQAAVRGQKPAILRMSYGRALWYAFFPHAVFVILLTPFVLMLIYYRYGYIGCFKRNA